MWVAVINNVPELMLGGVWSLVMIWIGFRLGKRFGKRV